MRLSFFFASCLLGPVCANAQGNRPIETGFEIMTNKQTGNCMACHDLPGVSGVASNFGPSLQGIGTRRTQEELTQWVVDARKINPETLMPPFGSTEGLTKVTLPRNILSAEQIERVVSTLKSWR